VGTCFDLGAWSRIVQQVNCKCTVTFVCSFKFPACLTPSQRTAVFTWLPALVTLFCMNVKDWVKRQIMCLTRSERVESADVKLHGLFIWQWLSLMRRETSWFIWNEMLGYWSQCIMVLFNSDHSVELHLFCISFRVKFSLIHAIKTQFWFWLDSWSHLGSQCKYAVMGHALLGWHFCVMVWGGGQVFILGFYLWDFFHRMLWPSPLYTFL
jgi:hypothetical protein